MALLSADVETREVSVEGDVTLRVRSMGEGDPLVLLTGGPGFAGEQLWSVATSVAESHRAIVIDQRGTPASPVDDFDTGFTIEGAVADLETVREQLGLDTWTLLGHSWGGLLSMAYAAEHPERVERLILICPAGIDASFWQTYQTNIQARLTPEDIAAMQSVAPPTEQTLDAMGVYVRSINQAIGPATLGDRSATEALLAEMTPERFEPRVNLAMQRSLFGYDLREDLADFEKPVTIIQGEQDPIGLDTTQRILDSITGSERILIEGVGHWPFLEAPERLAELIEHTLAE